MNEIDYELLLRHIRKECTERESEKVNAWLEADYENRNIYDILKKSYDEFSLEADIIDIKNAWKTVADKIGFRDEVYGNTDTYLPKKSGGRKAVRKPSFHLFGSILKYAAILLVIVSISIVFYIFSPKDESMHDFTVLKEIVVDYGSRANITLPDGSKVMLDAGSRFKYPEVFDNIARVIWLEGEGYFEVIPDENKPFVVQTDDSFIKVLGTKFNIRAWSGDEYKKVVVIEGRVSVNNEDDLAKRVILEKDQMSIIKNGDPADPVIVDSDKSISWLQNEIDFNDVKLSEIFDQLERWYDVEISIDDRRLLSMRLKLHVKRVPLNDILNLISSLTGFIFENTGGEVLFRSG
jgi:ferric-dicitrate binding protein FerR (iron transport regulator)